MSGFTRELRFGWRNLLAATVGLSFGVPGYTAISSLFLHAIETEFHWSRALAAGALIALPLTAIALPIAGALTDRLGVRIVAGFSAIAAAFCFFWLAHLPGRIGVYYAALIALNVLGCGTGPVTYTRLVAAEFVEGRGAALAIAQLGIALLAAFVPPTIGAVIATEGWRAAYLVLAAACLAGGVAAQLLMQPRRREVAAADAVGLRVREAIRRPGFWVLGLAILATSTAALGLVAQFQSVLVDRGIDRSTTTWLLSLLSVSVMVSRLVVGRLLDLARPTFWAAAVLAVAALGAALLLAGPTSLGATAAAIFLLGFSIGAELDLMAFFCARLFGLRHYSAIYGLLTSFYYCGIAAGGIGYGAIRDRTGSFAGGLGMSAVLLGVAAALFLLLRRYGADRQEAAG